MGLDYVDLYLEHWPKFFDYEENNNKINMMPVHKIWPLMEKLVEKGYTKYIGVSNYNISKKIGWVLQKRKYNFVWI